MARPRKDRRDIRLTFRCTGTEAGVVNTHADAAGVTLSDFLRAAALKAPMPTTRSRRKPVENADELAAVLRGIGRIGNNINQLARVANAGSWPSSHDLEEARSDIRWIRSTLMKALGVRENEPRP